MLQTIPTRVDAICAAVARRTKPFIETTGGKIFLSLMFLWPLTFLPMIYLAWTANDIEALRSPTWPLMIIINTSSLLGVIHHGDWRTRLVMILWVLAMVAISAAIIVR